MTKVCTKCGKSKDTREFYYLTRTSDKQFARCKVCQNESHKNWLRKNPTKSAEYNRKWCAKNREVSREYKRRWYAENREKKLAYQRKYRARKKAAKQ